MKQGIISALLLMLLIATTNAQQTGSFTDSRDGRSYKTVKIGTQWWMAENLAATKFNDVAIPLVSDSETWISLSTPAFCWVNDDVMTKDSFGALYNWYAINSGELCPAGWHIPTDEEWQQLEIALGLSPDDAKKKGIRAAHVGGKLKESGMVYWHAPNTGASNGSGFAGRPEGHRNWKSGQFVDVGLFGTWWSATSASSTHAWRRTLNFEDSNIRRFTSHKRDGFSVRCVKDTREE